MGSGQHHAIGTEPPLDPASRRRYRPQPVLTPLTDAAIFLVFTVAPEGEETVRDLLGDVAALARSVGFRVPEAELTCVVGIGASLFDRLFAGPRPAELHEFREVVGKEHTAVGTPGDLLFHLRSRRADASFELAMHLTARLRGAATVVDETHGFRYFEQRDLLGFVDGTENPVGVDGIEAATIGDQVRCSLAAATSSCGSTCMTSTPGNASPPNSKSR